MRGKISNLKDKVIEETVKAVFMVLIYLFYNKGIYTQKDFLTKLRDSSAILIPYLIYIFIVSIGSICKQPIIVNIKMKNFLIDDKEETILYHHKGFREDASKVVLNLEVKENNSVWASIARWLFKNKTFIVEVPIKQHSKEFICQPCEYPDEISFQGSFFTIDISDIILCNLEDRLPGIIKYDFVVKENQDNPPATNRQSHIKPTILIDKKKPNFFQSLFIKYNLELKEGKYLVKFIK